MNSMSYGDYIDPRRRMPGSGMPPSSAPNIMSQVGRGTPFAGQAPQPMPRQPSQLIDPQVLKMLMEMLQRGGQRQGPGQASKQRLIGDVGLASILDEADAGQLGGFTTADKLGMLSALIGQGAYGNAIPPANSFSGMAIGAM